MNARDIERLNGLAQGTRCHVAYVRAGLNVAMITGVLTRRGPCGPWRIDNPDRSATGFIEPEDRVTFRGDDRFRVDLS